MQNKKIVKRNMQITDLIYTIRNTQVMLDSDLAMLYQVETRVLNQAVKRNIKRFPEKFMFRLTEEEYNFLLSQFVIAKNEEPRGGRQNLPYVFTEPGIAMLSSILRSDIAISTSISIMEAFVEMRRFLMSNQLIFSRLDKVELKQVETRKKLIENDKKFEKIFDSIAKTEKVQQRVFFDGQIYDAFMLFVDIIKEAKKKITLIDNYVGLDTLNILSKRKNGIEINIYTTKKSKLNKNDISKFNEQYQNLSIKYTSKFHDRFLILDEKICYLIGASLKDAGNKSFGITKINDKETIKDIIARLL